MSRFPYEPPAEPGQGPALILFAHGARDPEWAAPLRRVRARIAAQAPDRVVELAFLEFMSPNLADCATALVAGGARAVTVVPMFIAQGGHLKRDVPQLIDALRAAHPDVTFTLLPAVGEADAVVAAMADYALAASQD